MKKSLLVVALGVLFSLHAVAASQVILGSGIRKSLSPEPGLSYDSKRATQEAFSDATNKCTEAGGKPAKTIMQNIKHVAGEDCSVKFDDYNRVYDIKCRNTVAIICESNDSQ